MSTELTYAGTSVPASTTSHSIFEIRRPSAEEMQYMLQVAGNTARSFLISPDMDVPMSDRAQMKQEGYSLQEIMEYRKETVQANILAKMLMGYEMFMDPMAAQMDIDIVKGKAFIRYPQLIRQMELKGYEVTWTENSKTRAAITLSKPGKKDQEFSFTIEDAKTAGLTSSEQYTKRPRVMLAARVVSEAYRMTGGRANLYSMEEKAEILNQDGRSTTDEPDEKDVQQTQAVAAKNDFTVEVKEKPAETENTPLPNISAGGSVTASVSPAGELKIEPPAAPAAAPAAVKTNSAPAEKKYAPDAIRYSIVTLFQNAAGGYVKMPVPNEPPEPDKNAAIMRARALANSSGQTHLLVWKENGQDKEMVFAGKNDLKVVDKPADKPAEPAATPKQTAAAAPADQKKAESKKSPQAQKLEEIRASLQGNVPEASWISMYNGFFSGLYSLANKKEVKEYFAKNPQEIEQAIYYLRCAIWKDENAFRSAPERIGEKIGEETSTLRSFLTSYIKNHPDYIQLALDTFVVQNDEAADWIKWYQHIGLAGMSEDANRDAFRLMNKTRTAGALIRLCSEHNLDLVAITRQMEQRALGGYVEDSPSELVEKTVQSWIREIQEKIRQAREQAPEQTPAQAAVAEAQEQADDDEQGPLFT